MRRGPVEPVIYFGSDGALRRHQYEQMAIPPRKRLPHEIPFGIDPARETYFITICCNPRGQNQLARSEIATPLFETMIHRNDSGDWFVHFALLMPDHLHFFASFPETGKRMQTVVSKWKEWTAKTLGISWQRDFFEHRLRRDESYREKADYIFANPARAGLVREGEEWPYILISDYQPR
jgi:putative transposase